MLIHSRRPSTSNQFLAFTSAFRFVIQADIVADNNFPTANLLWAINIMKASWNTFLQKVFSLYELYIMYT